MSYMDRRSFLKIAGLSSSLFLFPKLTAWAEQNLKLNDATSPNIILLVLDAMSANNLSLYGYPRQTSPYLARFAERATVYHSHYSSGNFTTSGTSSLLTGTYPWTHRAINMRGVIKRSIVENNIFAALGDQYTRLAFPQNFWAAFLLTQMEDQIEMLLPTGAFSETDFLVSEYFPNDANMAARSLDDFVFKGGGQSATPLLTPLIRGLYSAKKDQLPYEGYPKNIPYQADYPIHFTLEKVFDGLMSLFPNLKSPFFTYLHLLPPHAPYTPSNLFSNMFNKDGLDSKFPQKPTHPLSGKKSKGDELRNRRKYDEYIAATDHQIGRFLNYLESSGLLESSYVFITSDHGEMFERGELAHSTPLLYEPVIHIPLLVSAPGQKTRRDIYAPTNAVDILPTIAQIAGKPTPARAEGFPLPGLGNNLEDFERSFYVVEAKLNPANQPLKDATIVLRKGTQKLIYYTGYDQEDSFELYDLENDIEEMRDLFPQKSANTTRMKNELLEAFYAANKPYMK